MAVAVAGAAVVRGADRQADGRAESMDRQVMLDAQRLELSETPSWLGRHA